MRPCLIKIKKKTRYTVENSLGPISPAGHNQHTDKSYHQDRGHSVTARTPCVSYAIVSFLVLHFYNLSAQRGHMLAQGGGSQHLSHKPETWVPFPWMASVIPALTELASLESCSLEAETRFSFAVKQMEKIHFLRCCLHAWTMDQHALPHDNVNKNIKENHPSNSCEVISKSTALFVFLQTGFRCQEPASFCFWSCLPGDGHTPFI